MKSAPANFAVLPPKARRFAIELFELSQENHAVLISLMDRLNGQTSFGDDGKGIHTSGLILDRQKVKTRLKKLIAELEQKQLGYASKKKFPDTEAAIKNTELELKELTTQISELTARQQLSEGKWTHFQRITHSIESWIANLPRDPIAGIRVVNIQDDRDVKARDGQNVANVRAKLAELRVKRARILGAPLPSQIAKDAAKRKVGILAELGRPRLDCCFDDGSAPNLTPDFVNDAWREVASPAEAAQATLFWLKKDEILERLLAEIDEQAEDDTALTDDERNIKVAEIELKIEALERVEVSIIRASGDLSELREDTSPKALLNIVLVENGYDALNQDPTGPNNVDHSMSSTVVA